MERSITDARTLGAAIQEARTARNWTQAQLAERAGVSRALVIALERGSRPRAELARVLAVLRTLEKAIRLVDEAPRSFNDVLEEVLG